MSCTCPIGKGMLTCHCVNEVSIQVKLAPWNGDALLDPDWRAEPFESTPDGRRVVAESFSDLVRAHPQAVERGRFRPPRNRAMHENVILDGEGQQVLASIVSPVQIEVVNVILSYYTSISNPVLVGFDVLASAGAPAEADVAVGSRVPARLVVRDALTRREVSDGDAVAQLAARSAEPALWGSSDGGTAGHAWLGNDDHVAILAVSSLCHRTFTGQESFDRHQSIENGTVICRDPATWLKDDGDPLFMAYRETPDGRPIWGRYRPDLPQRVWPVPA